jgi:hypothetical protein
VGPVAHGPRLLTPEAVIAHGTTRQVVHQRAVWQPYAVGARRPGVRTVPRPHHDYAADCPHWPPPGRGAHSLARRRGLTHHRVGSPDTRSALAPRHRPSRAARHRAGLPPALAAPAAPTGRGAPPFGHRRARRAIISMLSRCEPPTTCSGPLSPAALTRTHRVVAAPMQSPHRRLQRRAPQRRRQRIPVRAQHDALTAQFTGGVTIFRRCAIPPLGPCVSTQGQGLH